MCYSTTPTVEENTHKRWMNYNNFNLQAAYIKVLEVIQDLRSHCTSLHKPDTEKGTIKYPMLTHERTVAPTTET